jgi:hypothetical protein
MPKLKRRAPEFTSVPTRPSSRPRTTIAIAFTSDPCARTTAAIRPHTIKEKYSAGPNCRAMAASGGAANVISKVETQPAKNEASAAMPSAGPARPLSAIWWPSMVVTTDEPHQGC